MEQKICIRGEQCVKGNILQDISEFYKHPQMLDGHLNKCKSCCKKEEQERKNILNQDPNFVEKEKQRHRAKYHRLGYKDIYKPSKEEKKETIRKYKEKYPEKYKAKNVTQKLPRKTGNELHHWSYNQQDWLDIIELSIKDHSEIHTHMVYDPEYMYYRDNQNTLLNTKQKHLNYIKQFINI